MAGEARPGVERAERAVKEARVGGMASAAGQRGSGSQLFGEFFFSIEWRVAARQVTGQHTN